MGESIKKKILIVGPPNVGKESLCRSYNPKFSAYFGKEYTPCIPETATVSIGGQIVELEFLLVTFDADYKNLRQLCYPNTDVILICFSIDSPNSLYDIEENIAPEISYKCPNKPIILVGNKKDLRRESPDQCLKTTDGEKMATKIGAVAYIENSALTMDGVKNVFDLAVTAAVPEKKNQWNCTIC